MSLARHSETVPGSGDVSEGPVPLSVSPTNTTQHPQFEARVAADNCITKHGNSMLICCMLM